MKTTIVTSGEKFTDIDAFACAIAYNELLGLEGRTSEVVLPGVLNNSVSPMVKRWNFGYKTKPCCPDYDSVLVDVSEPAQVAKCAPVNTIVEVYDHRYGFENFWKEKIGGRAHIDQVGACATLIWEEFKRRGLDKRISTRTANLLLVGIVSNTLNFGAKVTDKRDIEAARELSLISDMPKDWKETYFKEQEEVAIKDTIWTIISDTKVLEVPNLQYLIAMGQLELWDGDLFIKNHLEDIKRALATFSVKDWFMSIPSISEKKNHLYAESDRIKELLKKAIGAKFDGNYGVTKELWLRKEIRKRLFEMHQS